ncbi:histidinol dehydrogenase [Kushneria phosphatilytica]|uniref:Histidinol dehydrogenase n=1 Tax=Kushneria phosphatilytica TaxID=657387 RepID=A0A1S1NT43_9GAMM|nr:histidinol dehydrogenase [Kushneria phosphatilytica]OHV08641.1 histidinol dehydrogenase [Kushneria phosphatilytica]QEL12353.1 histidinol dehydrogenase [Kushneria phosphatilytica]
MRQLDSQLASSVQFLKQARIPDTDSDLELSRSVMEIIFGVRERGDAAIREYSNRFDGVEPEYFEVTRAEREVALNELDSRTRQDTEFAIAQVRRFAEAQLATLQPLEIETLPGVHLGHRILPIAAVGCYVPGGRYPLLSAPIMSLVPATVAGCSQIVACLPPNAHPSVVAICHLAGAHRIFRIGGAQAIAAMAHGTESVPAVDKIMGPGNAFVNEAKRQVFGSVGIDALAGPSEIFTLADDSADPRILAADMLAQAEHDPHARPGMATTSARLARDTIAEVERQLESLSSREVAGEAWRQQGEVVVCADEESLIGFADYMATEHLQIHARNAHALLERISNYGSAFIGQNASVVFSDKCCGTNHTLPTGQAARYTGGLWVGTYLKTCTHQWIEPNGIEALAPSAIRQSLTERMEGHARAAAIRLYPDQLEEIVNGHIPDA